ncbi:S-adenosyl-L-methionine-dependent methyltransferase [Gonapodya prolifera JEL478]|uniref:S-adenosyl-L-methionine-dependent methyltransferase n=1 Tax=Gonapodya prolifera (strain JEL478) TaxID=1344416 RepID=A0A139AEW0_GONPJ|nr:S-adenosyl-L-methionine-dependent methyltransferase [Gonapodya prolifera JEL478]|eukprot:KXS15317.1 S-adenosyl-L-methionine-dependent methyltransferase [Gonapodya prolifera JEL478]
MSTYQHKDFPSHLYSRHRPTYSDDLFDLIYAWHVKTPGARTTTPAAFETAVDVGCGTGQATVALSGKFGKVYGLDFSEAQISNAVKGDNIEYRVGSSSHIPLPDKSVDLITAAECYHYFEKKEFFKECKRVLKPNGTIAIWGYAEPYVSGRPDLQPEFKRLFFEQMGPYWPRGFEIIANYYRYPPLPFGKVERLDWPHKTLPDYVRVHHWTLQDYKNLMSTWSGTKFLADLAQSTPGIAHPGDEHIAWLQKELGIPDAEFASKDIELGFYHCLILAKNDDSPIPEEPYDDLSGVKVLKGRWPGMVSLGGTRWWVDAPEINVGKFL